MLILLVLVAVVALSMVFLARQLGRAERDPQPPAQPVETAAPEQTGLGEPEWEVVIRGQCRPLDCPNFKGNPRQPGKEPGCQVCAALFLEQYGERLLRSQREGRNR
ncbi:MAG: hypothetical protein HY321_01925 [Armatimonadetes bacterium]|nr:hypothetical protein [Armatimonadota bacterium]